MPEGVEVRKFADILIHNLVGHSIVDVNILKGRYTKKSFDGFRVLTEMLPAKIVSVKCKGKMTYIELHSEKASGKTVWMINTLGLTGGWTVAAKEKKDLHSERRLRYMKKDSEGAGASWIFAYPVIWEYISNNNANEWFERALDHLNVELVMDDGRRGYFYDQLSFGTLKVVETRAELEKKLKELGADMLDETTGFEVFKKAVVKGGNKEKMIGNVLVNQRVISGIGNYLRADGLWLARVSPFRKVGELSNEELETIYKSIRALMWGDYAPDEARKKGYIGGDFKIPHDYGREFFVYRQETDIEGRKVVKEELYEGSQKRFIYWIPEIQL
jgi:formamidopyrimidine-DNA glycosylase